MPQEKQERENYTVDQFMTQKIYPALKNPNPRFNGIRKIANDLKQQGGGKIKTRDFVLHFKESQDGFDNKYNILDLTEPPPASSSKVAGAAKTAASEIAASPEVQKRGKVLDKVLDLTKQVIDSDPQIATAVTAAKHPFTPLSEQLLGPGMNLEHGVRAANEAANKKIPAGVPSAVTAIPRYAQELVARGAATLDQVQTPAGMASVVLGATPMGGFLGKAMPWLQKMAMTTAAGVKSWDVVGKIADMSEKGVTAEGLADVVYDATEAGVSMLGMKAGRPSTGEITRPSAAAVPPPLPASATPPQLPPGTDVATISKGVTPQERQLQEMPVQTLRDQASDVLRKMRGVHGETSPYKTDAERIRASSTLQQRLAEINKHIVNKGGTPVNVPPPAPGGPSQGKINLQQAAGKTATGLPSGSPPPRSLPQGQYEMPGNRGELGPGEQTPYGPKTADVPGQFTTQKATKVAKSHSVKPDDVLQMSRQSNEDLRDATNQLIHLRAQLHAQGGSATYIDQLTNHINAMTEVLLERDRVSTAPPPRR